MKMTKRIFACILALCLIACAFVGCGDNTKKDDTSSKTEKVDTSGVDHIYFLNFKPEIADKYEAIVAAIQTYEILTEEEKLEVSTAHDKLFEAIANYNAQAVEINKEHVEAADFALAVFSGAFALLPALLWFVKKRFMM